MNDIKKKGKAEVKNSFYKDLFFPYIWNITLFIRIYGLYPSRTGCDGRRFRYIGAAVLCLRISSRYFDLGA